jgi:hypothetical protein
MPDAFDKLDLQLLFQPVRLQTFNPFLSIEAILINQLP